MDAASTVKLISVCHQQRPHWKDIWGSAHIYPLSNSGLRLRITDNEALAQRPGLATRVTQARNPWSSKHICQASWHHNGSSRSTRICHTGRATKRGGSAQHKLSIVTKLLVSSNRPRASCRGRRRRHMQKNMLNHSDRPRLELCSYKHESANGTIRHRNTNDEFFAQRPGLAKRGGINSYNCPS